jgi:membrane protease YdiL (CAAX protease family)
MQTETLNKTRKQQAVPSREALAGYLWSVAAGWVAMIVAGLVYAHMKKVAAAVAIPIIAAFLLELPLYLAPLFEGARAGAARMRPWQFAALLSATAVLPYLVYSIPTGYFNGLDLYRLAGLAAGLAFWYLVLPKTPWSDLLFLAAPAAIMISKIFKQIYWSPLPHVPIDILGKLMLIHVAALSLLVLRGLTGVKPGLIPTRREAWIGLQAFLFFLPLGFALAWILHLNMRPAPLPLWYGPPIFLGIYLTVAFSEEFGFRGVLQQHLSRALDKWVALAAASILFGLSHLNFGLYPNWHMVELAGAAGLFYGWAYQETGSIRASMVTHALTVTVWSIWLR